MPMQSFAQSMEGGYRAERAMEVGDLQKQFLGQEVQDQADQLHQKTVLNDLTIKANITSAADKEATKTEVAKLFGTAGFQDKPTSEQMKELAKILMPLDPVKGIEALKKGEDSAVKETKDREEKLKEVKQAMSNATASIRSAMEDPAHPEKFDKEMERIAKEDPKQAEAIRKVIGNLKGKDALNALNKYIDTTSDQVKLELAKINSQKAENVAMINQQTRMLAATFAATARGVSDKEDKFAIRQYTTLNNTYKKQAQDNDKAIKDAQALVKKHEKDWFKGDFNDAQTKLSQALEDREELNGEIADKLDDLAVGANSDKLSNSFTRMAENLRRGKPSEEPKPAQKEKKPSSPSSQDSEALAWAKANPKDPRAAKILAINKGK